MLLERRGFAPRLALLDEFGNLEVTPPSNGDSFVMPLDFDLGGNQVRTFITIATFGTPLGITLSDLAIETLYRPTSRAPQSSLLW